MKNKDNQITLLGVGNILLQDEGLGVHAVNKIKDEYNFSPSINIIDGGTMGMELLSYMEGTDYLLVVDAIDGGEEPGFMYTFTHEDTDRYMSDSISVHEVGVQDILRIRALQERPFSDVVIMGIQPQSLELGLEVTETIQAVLPLLEESILNQLRLWQVQISKK